MHNTEIKHLQGGVDCLVQLSDYSRLDIHATITCII